MSSLPGPDPKPIIAERALTAELDPFHEAAVEAACDLDRASAFRQAEPVGPVEAESMPLPFAERVD